jgi:hypothetical protein
VPADIDPLRDLIESTIFKAPRNIGPGEKEGTAAGTQGSRKAGKRGSGVRNVGDPGTMIRRLPVLKKEEPNLRVRFL